MPADSPGRRGGDRRRPAGGMSAKLTIDRRTPLHELPEFLTPEEYQHYMGISRTTTYDLLRRGRIPHICLGKLKRIPKTALLARASGVE